MQVFALGSVRVERAGRTLAATEWTYAKSRELLLYLLCHPPCTREQMGLALWPDASAATCGRNLRSTLHHLRHALNRAGWIVFADGHYAFNRTLPYWFDVEAFDTTLAAAQQLVATAPYAGYWPIRLVFEAFEADGPRSQHTSLARHWPGGGAECTRALGLGDRYGKRPSRIHCRRASCCAG